MKMHLGLIVVCIAWIGMGGILSGCGGSHTPRGGPLTLTLQWPERSRTVSAPGSALSCRLTLKRADRTGGAETRATWIIERESDPAAHTQEWVSPESVPAQPYELLVTFYAEHNCSGDTVAQARQLIVITDDGGDVGTVTLQHSIQTVDVPPLQILQIGERRELLYTAQDAEGATVAVTPGSVAWNVVTGDYLAVTDGVAEGHFAGMAEVTATIDGITSAPTPVTVRIGAGNAIGDETINPRDGAVMVWVPAGAFIMGSPAEEGFASEHPQHTVYLDGYWMYKYEVTVAQYRQYCQETGHAMPKRTPSWGWRDTDPMCNTTWPEAAAYVSWAGSVLPTEAQWEKAARGTDGRRYPWGDAWDATLCANTTNSDVEGGHFGPWIGGSFAAGASPFHVMDMAGNTWEWCADWYQEDYFSHSPAANPTGPTSGVYRVVRGGAWQFDNPFLFRCAYRNTYDEPWRYSYRLGFRCAMNP